MSHGSVTPLIIKFQKGPNDSFTYYYVCSYLHSLSRTNLHVLRISYIYSSVTVYAYLMVSSCSLCICSNWEKFISSKIGSILCEWAGEAVAHKYYCTYVLYLYVRILKDCLWGICNIHGCTSVRCKYQLDNNGSVRAIPTDGVYILTLWLCFIFHIHVRVRCNLVGEGI